jgi:ABC-2 type transport system permease protein
VQIVLGLAALLFTFSAICGEKESGTLKLTLANALPKDTLLLGKLLGNLLGLLVPVTLAFLLGLLVLLSFQGVSLSSEDLLRIALLAVDFLLYLTVLFALGLLVSTLTTHSTTAFALCLVAWVFLVAIAPRFAVLAAGQLSPPEPLQEFETKKVLVHRRGSIEAQEEYGRYLREHHQQSPPVGVYYDITRRIREKQNRELRILEDDYLQQKRRQDHWALLLSRFSPAGSLSYAAMSLARTSQERDFRFQAALRDYREAFTRYYDRKSLEESIASETSQDARPLLTQDLSDLPTFTFEEEPFAFSLERALPDLGFLLLWGAALFAGSYFRFLRYDVR